MMTAAPPPTADTGSGARNLLEVRDLDAGYGEIQALFGVSLSVGHDSVTAMLGPNGAGKSTLLKATMGAIPVRSGTVHLEGQEITGNSVSKAVRAGLAIAPEGRRALRRPLHR